MQRRANTGYMDGFYDFPSGHLEPGETLEAGAARETFEEVGLSVAAGSLELFHINQNNATPSIPYINFIFRTSTWTGQPKICEPHKCDAVGFFRLSDLPTVTPQVKRALADIASPVVTFSLFTKKDFRFVS